MSGNAGQYNPNERQIPRSAGGSARIIFRPENEERQEQEGQMNPDFYSEEPANM
jgi:hypothetical protein